MKNKLFITAIAVPVLAFALVSCSTQEDPWADPTPSPTESEYVPLEGEVIVEDVDSSENDEEKEAEKDGSDDDSISSPASKEQTAEGAAAFVNAFYVELASESRLASFEEKIAEKNPNWENSMVGDEEAETMMLEVLEEVYGDLAAQVDTEGVNETDMMNLYGTLYMSNSMHVLQKDMLPPVSLSADSIAVDGTTATFSMVDAYGDSDMEVTADRDSVLRYKDGNWLFTIESML